MINRTQIQDNVFRLVVKRRNLGNHSQYITNLAQECSIISLSKDPSDYDEQIIPKHLIDDVMKELDINWEEEMMLVVICKDNIEVEDLEPPEEFLEEFQWRKPVMSEPYVSKRIPFVKESLIKRILHYLKHFKP